MFLYRSSQYSISSGSKLAIDEVVIILANYLSSLDWSIAGIVISVAVQHPEL